MSDSVLQPDVGYGRARAGSGSEADGVVRDTAPARALGSVEAGSLVVGTVVGAGIFVAPAVVAGTAGQLGFGAVLLVWVLAGLLSVIGAAACAELAGMFPRSGGQYVYLREAFGPAVAFVFGWMEFWVARAGSIALLALTFAQSAGHFTHQDGEWGVRWTAFMAVFTLTAVNYLGVRCGASVQVLFTGTKLAALGALAACAFGLPGGRVENWGPLWNGSAGSGWPGALGTGLLAALWVFHGWASGAAVSDEVKRPERTVPQALLWGTAAVAALYLLVILAFHYVLPMFVIAAMPGGGVAAAVADRLFEDSALAAALVAAVVMIATFSSANGLLLTGPRIFSAMARDGLFPREMAELHPRFRTPHLALLFQGLWAALLVLVPFHELFSAVSGARVVAPGPAALLAFVMCAAWAFTGLMVAGMLRLRRTRPDAERPFRAWGAPWLPLLFLLASAALVAQTVWTQPGAALAAVGVALLGLPVYWWSRRAHSA